MYVLITALESPKPTDETSLVHDQHGDVLPAEDDYDYGNTGWGVDPSLLPTYALNMWVRYSEAAGFTSITFALVYRLITVEPD